MKDLCEVAGLSKQAYYQQYARNEQGYIEQELILAFAHRLRVDHPQMGCRKMYRLVNPPIGRDKFEQLLIDNGFMVRRLRNYQRTTRAGITYFDNLIEGLELTGIDQVWQSDITYIRVGEKYCYLVFIIDVFSRRILGYQASEHLLAVANTQALNQAINQRKKKVFVDLIHHSDRGCQYSSKEYVSLLRAHGIKPSMCKTAWQNAFAERINGIIKNEYLIPFGSHSIEELGMNLQKAVRLYNTKRPHWNLPEYMSPIQFEQALESGKLMTESLKLYQEVKRIDS